MLACKSGHALATTTEMSVEPCEARREREFLLAMRELPKATEQRVDLCTKEAKQERTHACMQIRSCFSDDNRNEREAVRGKAGTGMESERRKQ